MAAQISRRHGAWVVQPKLESRPRNRGHGGSMAAERTSLAFQARFFRNTLAEFFFLSHISLGPDNICKSYKNKIGFHLLNTSLFLI